MGHRWNTSGCGTRGHRSPRCPGREDLAGCSQDDSCNCRPGQVCTQSVESWWWYIGSNKGTQSLTLNWKDETLTTPSFWNKLSGSLFARVGSQLWPCSTEFHQASSQPQQDRDGISCKCWIVGHCRPALQTVDTCCEYHDSPSFRHCCSRAKLRPI